MDDHDNNPSKPNRDADAALREWVQRILAQVPPEIRAEAIDA